MDGMRAWWSLSRENVALQSRHSKYHSFSVFLLGNRVLDYFVQHRIQYLAFKTVKAYKTKVGHTLLSSTSDLVNMALSSMS